MANAFSYLCQVGKNALIRDVNIEISATIESFLYGIIRKLLIEVRHKHYGFPFGLIIISNDSLILCSSGLFNDLKINPLFW